MKQIILLTAVAMLMASCGLMKSSSTDTTAQSTPATTTSAPATAMSAGQGAGNALLAFAQDIRDGAFGETAMIGDLLDRDLFSGSHHGKTF